MSTPAQSRAELLLSAEKRMLEAIANRVSLPEVLDDLCRTVDAHSPGVISSVALMDADGKRLWLGAGPRFPAELKPVAFPWPIGSGRGACGTAAFLKQRVIISDLTIDPRWPDDCRDLPVRYGLRAAWSEPLISRDGAVLGTFAMYFGEPRIPDTSDLELIGAAGHIARIAIEMERSQVALRQSEKRFRLAAQAGKMFAYEWDAATDIIVRSGESAKILGIDEAAPLTGHQAISRVHPDDREGLLAAIAGLAPEKPFLQVTYRILRFDESVIWVERHSRAHFDEHGKIKRIVGMIVDITERKRAEVALLRHAAIVESSDDAIIGTDVSGTVTNWNKGAERLFGYLASEAIGKNISFLRGTDRSEEGRRNLKKVINGDVIKPYETVLRTKVGTPVDVSLRVSPIVDAEGRVVGVSGISRDITERKQSEKALRESEERFRSLYENSTLGLYRTTPDGKILLANPSLVKMLGYSSFSEIAQRNLEEEGFEPGYERAEFQHRLATEGEVRGLEASWARRDGTAIFVREGAKAIRDAEGKIAYYEGTVEDITERKRAEEALRQSEDKFSKAFRGSPLVVALTRMRDHRYLDVSESFEQWLGWRREEVIGRTPLDIGIWVDPAERSEFLKRLTAEGVVRNLEFRYRRKDGVEMVGLGSGELIEIGNEQCVISVITDITERKLAEERVRVSEERLRLAQQAAHIGAFEWNIRTGVNTWTPELEGMYGLPQGGFRGTQTAFEDLVHPDDRAQVIELVDDAMKTGQPTKGEWRVVWPDGSVHWIAGGWQVFMNESGKPSRMIGVNIDVTDRNLAEQELATTSERLHLAFESGSVGGWDYDVKTGKTVLFGMAHAQLGVSPDETSGSRQEFWDRVHAGDRERYLSAIAAAREKKEHFDGEFRVVWRDGTIRWLRTRGRYYYAADGEPERLLGISIDITERKHAEQLLRESEQRLRLATQAGRMYAYDWDITADVVVRSSEHVKILGLTEPLRFPYQEFMDKIHPDDRPRFLATIAGLTPENPTAEVTYRALVSDGTLVWLKSNGRGFFDAEGRLLRVIGMVADVTDQKRAEETLSDMTRKLVEAQEQERTRIGRELHDDINQRLALLAFELNQLQEKHNDLPSEARDHLLELQQMTADLCSGVYALSHELHFSTLDLLGLPKGMSSWCKTFGERHKIEIDFKNGEVPKLPQEISLCLFRVLQEALHNAAKHSGVERIDVQLAENSAEIQLIVSDSGKGFDINAASRSGGLGLMSMQERVRLVGGTILIDSKPLAGTTIRVCVPFRAEHTG